MATKKKTAAVVTPAPATTSAAGAQLLTISPSTKYSPRGSTAQGNAESWAALTAYLEKAKGKKATMAELQAHLQTTRNHAPFVKYCVRRGWLVAAK